jgi:ligand-binding sensor domain-containing protein/serine phosphatase RsbU (regulator of sigma subunit)
LPQSYYFDNYSVQDGLAQSKVFDILQDSEGFIWLGTGSGVSKYDGMNFYNFTIEDGLKGNGVRKLFEDSHGTIWMGHVGGNISTYIDGEFVKILPDSINIKADITDFIEDSNKRLWISTQGGGAYMVENLGSYGEKPLSIHHFTGKTKLSDRVFDMVETNNGCIYFIIDGVIKVFNEETKGFDIYRPEGLSYYFQITTMFEDKNKNRWFGTYNGGLHRLDFETGNITTFDSKRDGLANNFVTCISQDINGHLWIGTWGGGITRISPDFTTFNQENGLQDNKIWCITNDREGNLLIGTHENGFSIFKGEQFVAFNEKHGLTSTQISAIAQDNYNNMWIGTLDGLFKYNLSGQQIKPLNITKKGSITEIVAIKKGLGPLMWIATKSDGIFSYNTLSKKMHYPAMVNNSIIRSGKVTTCMEVDKEGMVWIGTIDGLFYHTPQNNGLDRVLGSEITALFCDCDSTMWISTKSKGIAYIKGTSFFPIDTLNNITAMCMVKDAQNKLWIGTEGQGIIVYDNNNNIKRYSTIDGLLTNLITAVQTDKAGNIWIGTNLGLNQYNTDENKFHSYTKKSGFTGIEVKNQAMFTDFDNNLWVGTVAGLFKYSPQKDKPNTLEPSIHITNFKVNLKDRPMEKGLKLNYNEKNIFIEYHAISLKDPDKVLYQIKLEGADNDWQPPTKQTFKNYSPLPPGRYTFKVKACNDRNIWNTTPASFSFYIKPPFYLSWWFISIITIVIITSVVMYIQIREQNLVREKEILEQKVKERTAEVVHKNEELALKNKNILDSIQYAQRIQEAILPASCFIQQNFPDSFVLFKPKDIVSGDFYFFEAFNDKLIFAAVDCTGHGVPGAFMSIVGHDGLKRATNEFQLSDPGEILDKLNQLVQGTLQSETNPEVKDGMDISLCVYYPKTQEIKFAGANNPIYIVRKDNTPLIKDNEAMDIALSEFGKNLYETKGNKQPIGAYINRTPFTTHTFQLQSGDSVYVFSDGYADQFGGPKGKKFMYRTLKKMLLEHNNLSMVEQDIRYNEIIENWRGSREQIDDICLMGVRV